MNPIVPPNDDPFDAGAIGDEFTTRLRIDFRLGSRKQRVA
jgi:hypothetical protein